MVPSVAVNWMAVLLALIAQMVIGFLWYSPMLFLNQWLKLSGKKLSDIEKEKKDMPKTYFWMVVSTLVLTYVLSHTVKYAQASTVGDALLVGFFTWLGYVATTSANSVLFEGKPFKLYLLNNGHLLLGILVGSVILTVWA